MGGSVYAGGDYGGDSADLNYDTITVNGFSHVYIDEQITVLARGYWRQKDGDCGGVFEAASCW